MPLSRKEPRVLLAEHARNLRERLARRAHALTVPERPVTWTWLYGTTEETAAAPHRPRTRSR